MVRLPLAAGARALAFAALLAAALAAPQVATAALSVRTSVEGLARTSDAVVRGHVVRRSSYKARGRIWTEVEVQTADVWRGEAPPAVKVVVPGGVVGDLGMRVSGAPQFADGEEVVMFLRHRGRGAFGVNGLAQGKFRVEGAEAKNDLGGTAFAKSEVGEGERAAEAMSMAELERRVRAVR